MQITWKLRTAVMVLLSVSGACGLIAAQTTRHIDSLMVDMLSEPIGLDDPQPVFSWKIRDPTDGARQTAYRIRVTTNATELGALVWDSGRVESAQSIGIPYSGPPLKASYRYFWTVQTWDKDGKPYPISTVSNWETGLMSAAGWKGDWIGYERPEDKSIRE